MMKTIWLLSALCLSISNILPAQTNSYYRDKVNFLNALTPQEIIDYTNQGNDLNEVLDSIQGQVYTVFMRIVHNYGFACDHERKDAIYYILKSYKEPLINPLYFLDDLCLGRMDLLEYFSLLYKYNHSVTEDDFNKVLRTLYRDWSDPQSDFYKTPLMYACEFNYEKSAARLITETEDDFLDWTDQNGKTALMYACETDNIKTIDLLIKSGCNPKIRDHSRKNALKYCKSPEAIKLIKESMKTKR